MGKGRRLRRARTRQDSTQHAAEIALQHFAREAGPEIRRLVQEALRDPRSGIEYRRLDAGGWAVDWTTPDGAPMGIFIGPGWG